MTRDRHLAGRPCYLDYNAGAPIRPAVAEAVSAALARTGNPSSVHRFGRLARRAVEDARAEVAALVGARPGEVVFTGSGSEANNLALRGTGRRPVVAAIEHDSVLRAAPDATPVAVDEEGAVDLAALDRALAAEPAPALVSVMLANNETGVVQPIAEVFRVARAHGALVHCDAVQAASRMAIERDALGVDLLTLSAHKLGGPQGVGALVVSGDLALAPLIRGGGQEMRRRAGTENVAGIVGFGVAARLAAADLDRTADWATLRDRIEQRLRALAPELRVFGAGAARLCNTTCLTMPGVAAETQVMALDLAGVAVGAGAACSSGKVGPSHVLAAMGAPPAEAACAIRVSLGWASEAGDIERLVDAWGRLHARTRRRGRDARPATG